MGGTTNFPLGFQNGISLRGVPVEIPVAGQVFWVDSTSTVVKGGVGSSDGNPGTYQKPFATLDFAVGRCTANRGDVIYLKPGHTETIGAAAAVDLDVAGITVIGLGTGTLQARLDYTATAGTVEVNADNISIVNVNFHANVPAVVIGLSVLTLRALHEGYGDAANTIVADLLGRPPTTLLQYLKREVEQSVGDDGSNPFPS